MSADAHTGHIRFDFGNASSSSKNESVDPWVFIQVSRQNWTGDVHIDVERQEVYDYNTERQDYLRGPFKAPSFKGYFGSRFSEPFAECSVARGGELMNGISDTHGNFSGAYVKFRKDTPRVEVRTGVSYVSVDQARKNLDLEIPNNQTFEQTVGNVRSAWLEKISRVTIDGVNHTDVDHDPRSIWYTGLFMRCSIQVTFLSRHPTIQTHPASIIRGTR